MVKKIEGIVISETNYGETSKIINLFTKEYGIIGIIAKGAKSLKSKLRNYVAPYSYGYYHVYYKENKLSNLIECEIINDFKYLKSDIILISYMNYLIELATQIYKQNDDNNIYSLLIAVLNKINLGLDPQVLTNILELKLLDYLGIELKLDGCVKCNKKTNIVTICSESGGFLCSDCCTTNIVYDEKVIKMLRMYYLIEIDSISTLSISYNVKTDINNFLKDYYEQYTGLYLNSKKYLETMLK